MAGYEGAFSKVGSSLKFNDELKSFAVANTLNDTTVDPRYGFRLPITATITPAMTYLDPTVSTQSQSVEAQATVDLLHNGGKNLGAKFTSPSSTLTVRAIATGSGGKKVSDVTLSSQYSEPGFGTTYSQVMFAVTNLGTNAASFSYSSIGQPSTVTEVSEPADPVPSTFALRNNYPNPFNPSTTIRYNIPTSGYVRLRVFDVVGREVASLVDGVQSAGSYSVNWHGTDDAGRSVASGVDFYTLESLGERTTKRMVLLK